MATNFVQKGDVVTVASPTGGVSAGDPVLIGELFGVATHDAAQTLPLELAVSGVWTLPGDPGISIALGDRVFWDSGNGFVDKTASAQQAVGIATETKGVAGTTVSVLLGGSTPAGT